MLAQDGLTILPQMGHNSSLITMSGDDYYNYQQQQYGQEEQQQQQQQHQEPFVDDCRFDNSYFAFKPTENDDEYNKPEHKMMMMAVAKGDIIKHQDRRSYYDQFIKLINEEIENRNQSKSDNIEPKNENENDDDVDGDDDELTIWKTIPSNGGFHRCQCIECLPNDRWISCPHYITTHLEHCAMKVKVFSSTCFHLVSNIPYLELFMSIDGTNHSRSIAIIFHNIRLNVRKIGNRSNENGRRMALSRVVEIANQQYLIEFRYSTVNFTSTNNLLTYSIDKSGCKTKVCRQKQLMEQNNFVNQRFQCELNYRDKMASKNGGNSNRKESFSNKLLRNCHLIEQESSSSMKQWSIENDLQIIEQTNGNLMIMNEKCKLYLYIQNRNNCLTLKLANLFVAMNKSGNFFIAQSLSNRSNQQQQQPKEESNSSTTSLYSTNELNWIRQNIQLLTASSGERSERSRSRTSNSTSYNENGADAGGGSGVGDRRHQFSINRAMVESDQFAICGIGGLLVKHHNRRAGLNQSSQICLL